MFTEEIDNPRYEGRLGSHDGEIHTEVFRQCYIILYCLRAGVASGDEGRAGIAGRGVDFSDGGRIAQSPSEGVLTAAAADN
jgi:hypothetical protein